jgi:tetratricopeptide (TPR) repeat protein
MALVALAVLDQWRYRLASHDTDQPALQAALSLNPFDSNVQTRLFRLLLANDRAEEARAQLDTLLSSNPRDIDLLVNAGVLAHRTNRKEEAARFWQRALDEDPSLPHVQLYLAESLDGQGRTADALIHYRRYLELVVQQRDRLKPDLRVVVPVVLKFADGLARTGHAAEARMQFELAATMAKEIGMPDLEHTARERLGQVP